MTEKKLVINNRIITYKGPFKINDLFQIINRTLDKLDYQKKEKKTEETVLPFGKKTYLELRPSKVKNSYITLMIKIKLTLENITEVTKTLNRLPANFQQGDVTIVFDAWLLTDYAARWGLKPLFFFIKAFVNKYIYRFPSEDTFVNELKSDTNHLTEQINAFLNLYKRQFKSEDLSSPTPSP